MMAKLILKKKYVGGLTLPDLKTYYKAVIIKTVEYWYEEIYIQNRTESLE